MLNILIVEKIFDRKTREIYFLFYFWVENNESNINIFTTFYYLTDENITNFK